MATQSRPDFIADDRGHIMDVRHLKYAQDTTSQRPQGPATTSSSHRGSDSTRAEPAQGSGAVLVFPIGLLITIVAFVFRLLGANRVS